MYVYLTRYAEEQQDLALLSISTFQRALKVVYLYTGVIIVHIFEFFLTCDLSLINTCCWRADHEILIRSQSALILSAQQNIFVNNCLLVRKKHFDSKIVQKYNAMILPHFSKDYFEMYVNGSTYLHVTLSRLVI